jgi:hypothetical protein
VARAFDSVTLTHENAAQALEILVNPANLPCLVHCYDGTSTTGLVVMCLRKLQSISMSFAVTEFERFQRAELAEPMDDEERLFVESFKHDIRAPSVTPKWLWESPTNTDHGGPHLRLSAGSKASPKTLEDGGLENVDGTRLADAGTLDHIIKESAVLEVRTCYAFILLPPIPISWSLLWSRLCS